MILAKFTVGGSSAASGINFQAAVPKVFFSSFGWMSRLFFNVLLVTTASDATDVKYERSTGSYRDSTNAGHCPPRGKPFFFSRTGLR